MTAVNTPLIQQLTDHWKKKPSELSPKRLQQNKWWAAVLTLSLFLIWSPAALSSVEVMPYLRSTERPQIMVTLQGTPQSNVKIEVYKVSYYPEKDQKVATRFTDNKGRATLPKLIPGQYHIVASIKPDFKADLGLEFIPEDPDPATRFSMELQPDPPYAAEKSPVATRISEFRGVVRNEAGAPIPRASIDVVQLCTQAQKHTTPLHADAQGRFAANLPDGDYLAFFDGPGLKERAIPLAISKAEGGDELRVVLQSMPVFSGATQ